MACIGQSGGLQSTRKQSGIRDIQAASENNIQAAFLSFQTSGIQLRWRHASPWITSHLAGSTVAEFMVLVVAVFYDGIGKLYSCCCYNLWSRWLWSKWLWSIFCMVVVVLLYLLSRLTGKKNKDK
ncbi:hypothetical protein DPMN_128231 [Dreissena polymorpha]|uniref:Transmembrane protein n=1 Tax=Dreissena polymorpha TaxID=45954 RepID=A0A9D4H3G9_DREPO|nr:hypothetical protein DPMN_128231 [Dreissena polymorpha]